MVVITIITISLVVVTTSVHRYYSYYYQYHFLAISLLDRSYPPSASIGMESTCVMEVIDENMRTACPKTLQATSCNDPEPNLDVHRQLQGVQKYLHQGCRKV